MEKFCIVKWGFYSAYLFVLYADSRFHKKLVWGLVIKPYREYNNKQENMIS